MNLLVIGDNQNRRNTVARMLETDEHIVFAAHDIAQALQLLEEEGIHVAFLDCRETEPTSSFEAIKTLQDAETYLSIIVLTDASESDLANEAVSLGAADFIEDPITPGRLRMTLRQIDQTRKLKERVRELESEIHGDSSGSSLGQTRSPLVQQLHDTVLKAAESEACLLILGESGVGKSHLARQIHRLSPRNEEPFVTVNCPSLTQELLASELFGHVKGSFTGAVKDRWGKVREADGGVLFLDEIGEAPMELQPKLLHLLQEKEYERVGENKVRKADIRIIAATNQDLALAVREGRFREDLFYRLNVITIQAPPLRDRKEDLQSMTKEFVQRFSSQCRKPGRQVSEKGWNRIMNYNWPGNIRELRNLIEREVILSESSTLDFAQLEPGSNQNKILFQNGTLNDSLQKKAPTLQVGERVTLADLESAHIEAVLESSTTKEEAADILGIDPATLYRKRKKYQIE